MKSKKETNYPNETRAIRQNKNRLLYREIKTAHEHNNQVCFEFLEPNVQLETNEEIETKSSPNKQPPQPTLQVLIDDDDSNTYRSDNEESQEATKSKIAGASTEDSTSRNRRRPKKKPPRNSYGCKEKPKTNIEINLAEITEPRNLREALESSQSKEWMKGINKEIENLKQLNTWIDEPSPFRNYIGSK